MNTRILIAWAVAAFVGTGYVGAAERLVLKDEPSREELARYAMTKDAVRAVPRKFEFPKHVVNGRIFGIDVSHHQGKINWSKVAGQGVRFAYVKASQGKSFYDGQFAANWAALKVLAAASQPVLRGAYHFMSAVDDPDAQADNYLSSVGTLTEQDLPPCLDVEWDFLRVNKKFVKDSTGKNIDQWSKLSSAEIVGRMKIWLTRVEKATGKRPVIYTNAAWWKERIGDDLQLVDYKLWIADYTSSSLNREEPRVPKKFSWTFWQMTDLGIIVEAGLTKGVDTNLVSVKDIELLPELLR